MSRLAGALRDAAIATAVAFGLFVIMVGLRTDVAPSGELFLRQRWRDVAIVGNGNGGLDTVTFQQPQSARFVRMQGVERATRYGYSIKEFGAFS